MAAPRIRFLQNNKNGMSFLSYPPSIWKRKRDWNAKGFLGPFNPLTVSVHWNKSMGFIFLVRSNTIYQLHWTCNIQAPRQFKIRELRQDWLRFTAFLFPHLRDTQVLIDGLYQERGGENISLKVTNTFPASQRFVTQEQISLDLTTQEANSIHMKKMFHLTG